MISSIKLTDALINYAKAGEKSKTDNKLYKKYANVLAKRGGIIRDSEAKGFQIARTGDNTVSFRFDYRVDGKKKNITIGQFPAITTVQARLLAKEKALEVANGNNPVEDKKAQRNEKDNTLKSYLDHEYALHMQSRAIRANRYLAIIRNQFPTILNKPLTEINKTDL